ncbi:manganese-superoxide dismutase [Apiospora phragmitis]|uniref:Superoxide dismutase [Mn], mitochondrial n=1 Tax=Apiospora phragmitis TaxID=2905665 RepID=A0ABR1SUP0_9PEZI
MAGPYTLPKLPYAYDHLPGDHGAAPQQAPPSLRDEPQQGAGGLARRPCGEQATRLGGAALSHPVQRRGHINHSLFWESLAPTASPEANPEAAPQLLSAIGATWGSLEQFQAAFGAALLGIQGSGWGWLVKEAATGQLRIVTLANQEAVVVGDTPLLGMDMWEHAYYLLYKNDKATYVKNIWQVINWKTGETRFGGQRDDAFKFLKAQAKI